MLRAERNQSRAIDERDMQVLLHLLEGYLKLAAGWTKEQELEGFPNLLILVPDEVREEPIRKAFT